MNTPGAETHNLQARAISTVGRFRPLRSGLLTIRWAAARQRRVSKKVEAENGRAHICRSLQCASGAGVGNPGQPTYSAHQRRVGHGRCYHAPWARPLGGGAGRRQAGERPARVVYPQPVRRTATARERITALQVGVGGGLGRASISKEV